MGLACPSVGPGQLEEGKRGVSRDWTRGNGDPQKSSVPAEEGEDEEGFTPAGEQMKGPCSSFTSIFP